ncbi:hypothetical protein [Streptomyces sp. ODS28]|uniref:hypothetical protein n=1 Tax=Streptomyces sp. ODS28 TaxID=3136688 RepID=UPI0031EFEDAC
MSSAEAVNRLVVSGDICGSGRMGREAKGRVRAGMYAAFAEAFDAAGVAPGEVHQEDRGDGILAALAPGVPSSPMVGRWVDSLYESLREHNAVHATRLRMRVAMHMGPVAHDGRGLVGRAVDLTCRLCDSRAARTVIGDAAGFDLLHVVSDWLYANVVLEGGRYIEPDRYRPVRVTSKETDELAWFSVPRLPGPPASVPAQACSPGESTPAEGPPAQGPPAQGPPARGGPEEGAGPPVAPEGIRNQFNVGGDNQVFERNVINGFTGIRKDRPAAGEAGGEQ